MSDSTEPRSGPPPTAGPASSPPEETEEAQEAEATEGESPHDTWKVDEQGIESFPASDPPG